MSTIRRLFLPLLDSDIPTRFWSVLPAELTTKLCLLPGCGERIEGTIEAFTQWVSVTNRLILMSEQRTVIIIRLVLFREKHQSTVASKFWVKVCCKIWWGSRVNWKGIIYNIIRTNTSCNQSYIVLFMVSLNMKKTKPFILSHWMTNQLTKRILKSLH